LGSMVSSHASRRVRRYRSPRVDCVKAIGLTGQTSLNVSTLRLQYSAAIWSGRAAGHRSKTRCVTASLHRVATSQCSTAGSRRDPPNCPVPACTWRLALRQFREYLQISREKIRSPRKTFRFPDGHRRTGCAVMAAQGNRVQSDVTLNRVTCRLVSNTASFDYRVSSRPKTDATSDSTLSFLLCSNTRVTSERPASWRMPNVKQMEKLAREAARRTQTSPSTIDKDEGWRDAVLRDPRAAATPRPAPDMQLGAIRQEAVRMFPIGNFSLEKSVMIWKCSRSGSWM